MAELCSHHFVHFGCFDFVHYSEVTLNDGTYHLFRKPNEEITYIYVKSDHPLKLSRKSQERLKKDYLAYLQERQYVFEISKDKYEQRQ